MKWYLGVCLWANVQASHLNISVNVLESVCEGVLGYRYVGVWLWASVSVWVSGWARLCVTVFVNVRVSVCVAIS